ncbi:ABC transporter substrate-binding protein [Actinopolymorpha pittospori]|uniref:Multiple sugar transport system substrate-binding protein n=1 Tax=Actinopolymorpha pittospori TaxID=648752 RepID=A0A927N6L3_9ACTN|nr:extracellular solute-binding protein [Actinopolymorpha pittospori]MBE1613109.1 multiple sugar transport system substrate-binding protein [Actinopolymorpha pittospori]
MAHVLNRRDLLRTIVFSAGLLGAAGCAGFGGGGGGSEGSGSLKVAWWGDADRAALYRKALKLFTTDNSGTAVTSEFADLDPYLKRLATQAAAGELPDVMWMRDTHVGRYASSRALLDLSKYVGDTIDVGALGDAAVADGKVGSGVYALPTHYVGQAVFVAGAELQKAGATYPTEATWDAIAELARGLTRKGSFWGCTDPTLGDTQRHFEAYVRQSGAELFDTSGQVGFGADVLGDWLDYWAKLRADGTIPPPDVEIEADASSEQNLLVTGKAAILWESSNHYPQVSALLKGPLEMYSMPTLAGGSKDWWFFPPILISVSAKTKEPELTAKMLNFFLNDEKAADITKVNQGAPSSEKIRELLVPDLSEPEAAFVEQISREMKNPQRPNPVRPEGSEQVNDAIRRTSQDVAYGRKKIPAAVSGFMTEAKRLLSS